MEHEARHSYISSGNTKLGHIPSYSVSPDRSCRPTEYCASICYDRKAARWPTVKKSRETNWEISQSPSFVPDTITAIGNLKRRPKISHTHFRLFEGGDFSSRLNALRWAEIMRSSDYNFLCYSRSLPYHIAGCSTWQPHNLSLYLSIDPSSDLESLAKDIGKPWLTQRPHFAATAPSTGQAITLIHKMRSLLGSSEPVKVKVCRLGSVCQSCLYCWAQKGGDVVFPNH